MVEHFFHDFSFDSKSNKQLLSESRFKQNAASLVPGHKTLGLKLQTKEPANIGFNTREMGSDCDNNKSCHIVCATSLGCSCTSSTFGS